MTQVEHELKHYGVLGMKWGVRKDTLRTMSRADKKATKAKYKSMSKEQRRKALIKGDLKLLQEEARAAKLPVPKSLDSPLSNSDRNAIFMRSDRKNFIKKLSDVDRVKLNTWGKSYADSVIDYMGPRNITDLTLGEKRKKQEDLMVAVMYAYM